MVWQGRQALVYVLNRISLVTYDSVSYDRTLAVGQSRLALKCVIVALFVGLKCQTLHEY